MSQQYSLRWNNHQPNFISMFTTLLNTQTLVDVTLAAEGKHLQAHKIVLSACSTYFQALFVDNPSQHPIVILKDVSFADLRTMVDFMYCGEVNVTEEQLPQVLDTAKHLKIKGLTEMPETTSLTRSQGGDLQSQGDSLDSNRHSASPAASPNAKRKRYGIRRKSSTGSTSLNMVEEHREEQQEPARESVTLSSLPQRRREYEDAHQNTDPHMNVEPLPMEGGSAGLPQDAASRQRRSKLLKRQSRVQPDEREVRKQISEPAPPAAAPALRKHESYPQYSGTANRTRNLDHEIGSLLIRAVTYIDRQTNPGSASTSFEEAAPATRASHTPAVRNGPPLSCNFCWNTVDECGRILRRKTQYHCPECQTNLCIVPCFHEYHEGPDAAEASAAASAR